MKKYQKIKVRRQVKASYLKAIVAGLFCSGVIGNAQVSDIKTDSKVKVKSKTAERVHCYGINACKGKSDCHTAKNSCSGKNACKGQGWKFLGLEDCKSRRWYKEC